MKSVTGKESGSHRDLFDHDRVFGNVLVEAGAAGVDRFDLVHHIHAVDHLAKHTIAPTLYILAAVIEEIVVLHIDEKLSGRTVRLHGSRHGNGAGLVLEAVVRLVLDTAAGGLLAHVRGHAAALNHETVNYP